MTTRAIGTPQHKGRRQPCPLSSDDVLAVVAQRATRIPLSTSDITEWCLRNHPDYPNITPYRVKLLLEYIARRNRVISFSTPDDTQVLQELGVVEPQARRRYWMIPEAESR